MNTTTLSDQEHSEDLVFICVDGSEESSHAFKWFCKHYHHRQHVVGIVHIFTPPHKSLDNYTSQDHQSIEERKLLLQRYFDICTLNKMEVRIFSRSKDESFGHTICELIKEHRPMSVVMGQRGLGVVKRQLFGSVSEYILRHARVPVLIVPAVKEEDKH